MAAIIITVILVAAIIGVSSWLIAVTAKSGKYNLIKVKKIGSSRACFGRSRRIRRRSQRYKYALW